MKKILLLLLDVVMFFSLSNLCFAQSAKDAVRALQKLQARVQTGISYQDYGRALGDARFEVNLFLNTPEAKEAEALAVLIERIMIRYQMAGEVWRIYFVQLQEGRTVMDVIETSNIRHLSIVFPEFDELVKESKIRTERGVYLRIQVVLQMIWTDADRGLNKAIAFIPNEKIEAERKQKGTSSDKTTAGETTVMELTGSGLKNTRPFQVDGPWELQWDAKGPLFIVRIYNPDGSIAAAAANQQGPGKGSSYQPKGGHYYLQINALGNWQVKVIEIK